MAKLLILVTLTIFVVIAKGQLGIHLGIGNDECSEKIESGLSQMEETAAHSSEELADLFRLCNEIEDDLDIQIFFSAMSEVFSLLVQFDQVANVAGVCDLVLDDAYDTPVEAVAALIVYLLQSEEGLEETECIDIDHEVENPQIDPKDPAVESREKTLQVVDAIISKISSKFVGTPVFGMLLGLLKVGGR